MKLAGVAAAFLLILSGQGAVAAPLKPQRIMSLTVCTDELLMELAPEARIASISYLSRERAALKLFPQAARLPTNHNSAEEVLAVHPEFLVLTLTYASSAMRPLLAKAGIPMLEVPEAESFDQIRANTRLVADVIGEQPRAATLLARMDATLSALAATRPSRPVRVAGWGGGGHVPGRSTLFNAVLEAAGGTNIAGPAGDYYYDVEGLIAAHPDVLAYGEDYIGAPSLRGDQDAHPALVKMFAGRRIVYPTALLGCGQPRTAEAARDLRAQLQAAMKQAGGAP